MLSEFQSQAMAHTSKNITSPTLEAAQPTPVPSAEDGTVWPRLQSMPPYVEETSTLQRISAPNIIHKKQDDTLVPSTRSLQKINRKRGALSEKPKASGLSKEKCVDTSQKCGTSGTKEKKHVDRTPKPGLQSLSDHQQEASLEKDRSSEVKSYH